MDLLCLLLNANSADKIHNTTTSFMSPYSLLSFNFTWSSQGSLILVFFSFYPDVRNKTKGWGLKYFCTPHTISHLKSVLLDVACEQALPARNEGLQQ